MTTNVSPKPEESVICTEFDDREGVLVDLNTTQYFVLNETALLVWRGLKRGRPLAEIVGELAEAYEVTPERAAASVERLLGELRDRRLISGG
jgi:hypothetical protein